jgi:acetyl-CoA synthetase
MTTDEYFELYKQSVDNPKKFWEEQARNELNWFTPFTKTLTWNKPDYTWFDGGTINITYNCLDRHILNGQGDQIAYIYNNERDEERKITYTELLKLVNKSVNVLQKLGITNGDRVIMYMPVTIELVALMLACGRMGAIHSVVYAGFSAEALSARILDTGAKLVCTATTTAKNGKKHDLLQVVRETQTELSTLVFVRAGDQVELQKNELDLAAEIEQASDEFTSVPLPSSTPLFILYTSGTTGLPKGIVHSHGAYNLYSHLTMKKNFELDPGQIHWTAADTGWITGHSYMVYGPLSNGITSVIYEGGPTYPTPDRYYSLIEKYKVNSFYTAPTVIRLLMREGKKYPESHKLESLKIIGSVGEPISPTTWQWYFEQIGKSQAKVIDTWWQTETGGHMLVTPPSLKQKPGSAGLPFYGVVPALVNDEGNEIAAANMVGHLVIKYPWPGALLTCWNNQDKFTSYWSEFAPAEYFYTGDVALRDSDGYYTVLGRADDVINVAGVRIGTAEVEGTLLSHEAVAEAAVIGMPDEIKGETIKAFVLLNQGITMTKDLESELKKWVKTKMSYMAVPEQIESVDKLPKTRSGKIMRRILKAKQMGLSIGDASTLDD